MSDIKSQLKGSKKPSIEIIMEALSDRYGWTPKQIREQNETDIKNYIEIITVKNILEKEKIKKIKR